MIRLAKTEDLDKLMKIYEAARDYMRKSGNPTQWRTEYPPRNILESDILLQQLYVVEIEGEICGAFVLIFGDDPTYNYIEDGDWPNNKPYGTIHRLASGGTSKGVFKQCIDFCKTQSNNLRIDTHTNNKTMRHLIEKHGFQRCGLIFISDGTSRIAYQFVKDE